MSRSAFLRSLLFAALAAAALWVGAPLLAPLCGARGAARFLLLAGVGAHVAIAAPSRGRGLLAAGSAALLGVALLALPLGIGATAVGGAAWLGVCRSGLLYRSRPARALLLELALLGSGLALAAFLADHSLASLALACWGFWLVQSAFFLVGGVAPRPEDSPQEDPFDRARSRILALLDP